MKLSPLAALSFLSLSMAFMVCLAGDLVPTPSTTLADFGYKWSTTSHMSQIPKRFRQGH